MPLKPPLAAPSDVTTPDGPATTELRSLALQALLCADPAQKLALTLALAARAASLSIAPQAPPLPAGATLPGRPERPVLVAPMVVWPGLRVRRRRPVVMVAPVVTGLMR